MCLRESLCSTICSVRATACHLSLLSSHASERLSTDCVHQSVELVLGGACVSEAHVKLAFVKNGNVVRLPDLPEQLRLRLKALVDGDAR